MEAGTVVVDPVLGPEAADEAEGLVEQGGPLGAVDPERPMLGGDRRPDAHRRQQPPVRQPIEARQLLGQDHRIPPREDEHAGAQLQLPCAAGGHRQGHQRIRRRAGEPLGQPQAVEAERLQVVEERQVALGVTHQRLRAQPDPDAHLHARRAYGRPGRFGPVPSQPILAPFCLPDERNGATNPARTRRCPGHGGPGHRGAVSRSGSAGRPAGGALRPAPAATGLGFGLAGGALGLALGATEHPSQASHGLSSPRRR
jgi:hypothetical protein